MTMLTYAVNHVDLYLLVLMRIAGFIGTAPVLSTRVWPMWAKVGLAGCTALWMAPTIHGSVPSSFTEPGAYLLDALRETATGMFLGMIANLIVSAVTVAGQAFDVQIGFSSAVLFDPQVGTSMGLSASLLTWIFTMYLLGIGGLDGLLLSMMNSYRFIPLAGWHLPTDTPHVLAELMGVMMSIGLQMVAPLLVALLMSDITFALLSRAVPQMNVFVVGLPAKLFVGLGVFAGIMPGVIYVMNQLFSALFQQMNGIFNWLGGAT